MLSENNKAGILLLAAILFVVYCFVFGQSGILERMRFQKERLLLQNEIGDLQKENVRLNSLLADYSSGKLARFECENAGYLSPGSKAYYFANAPQKPLPLPAKKIAQLFSIDHLRIAWITVSCMVLAAFYLVMRRRKRVSEVVSEVRDDETYN